MQCSYQSFSMLPVRIAIVFLITNPLLGHSANKSYNIYRIADAIASHLDVNTLDALSRTCQNIHSGLLQYRKSLLRITLRCNNDALPVDPDQVLRFRARQGIHEATWEMQGRVEGKSGQCATDMVGECRRCGIIVCRVRFPPIDKSISQYACLSVKMLT